MSKFRNFEKYEVYEDGRIWSYSRNKFLKPKTKKNGYKEVRLSDNEGKQKSYHLHRVVWESITGEQIPEGYEINHISEDKTENFFANLELVTHKQNLNFGTRNSRARKALSKQVYQYTKEGELISVWKSTNECKLQGFQQSAVADCCNGKRKSHKGYIWSYKPIE